MVKTQRTSIGFFLSNETVLFRKMKHKNFFRISTLWTADYG